MIFKLKLQGLSAYHIAHQLNLQNIAAPKYYRYIKNICKNEKYAKPHDWVECVVAAILENPVYTGCVVMGKSRVVDGKQCDVDKKDWTIIKNTHESIISQADFDSVAEQLRQKSEKYNNRIRTERATVPKNILAKFIFCKECGKAYSRNGKVLKDNAYRPTYYCSYCNQYIPQKSRKRFSQEELFNIIYTAIRLQIDVFVSQRDRFLKNLSSNSNENYRNELTIEAQNIKKELETILVRKLKLYDDYCAGIVNEENYRLFNQSYDVQKIELSRKLEELSDEISTLQSEHLSKYESISAIDKLDNQKELSREMLIAFVERIEVSLDQNVEVIFRYKDELDSLIQLNDEREGRLHG